VAVAGALLRVAAVAPEVVVGTIASGRKSATNSSAFCFFVTLRDVNTRLALVR
jgi:hypothetical protein